MKLVHMFSIGLILIHPLWADEKPTTPLDTQVEEYKTVHEAARVAGLNLAVNGLARLSLVQAKERIRSRLFKSSPGMKGGERLLQIGKVSAAVRDLDQKIAKNLADGEKLSSDLMTKWIESMAKEMKVSEAVAALVSRRDALLSEALNLLSGETDQSSQLLAIRNEMFFLAGSLEKAAVAIADQQNTSVVDVFPGPDVKLETGNSAVTTEVISKNARALPEALTGAIAKKRELVGAVKAEKSAKEAEKAAKQTLAGKLENLSKNFEDLNSKFKASNHQVEVMTQELASERGKVIVAKNEVDELNGRLAGRDAEVNALMQKLKSLEQDIDLAKAETEKAKRESTAIRDANSGFFRGFFFKDIK